MMGHDTRGRINRESDNFFRRVMGNRFDVHAAFGGCHESHARGDAINQQREIEFFFNGRAVFHIKTIDLLTGFTGLDGDQRMAEHFGCILLHFIHGFGKAHTALFTSCCFFEFAFAAPARMDLGFHNPNRTRQFRAGDSRFIGIEDRKTLRHRNTKFP